MLLEKTIAYCGCTKEQGDKAIAVLLSIDSSRNPMFEENTPIMTTGREVRFVAYCAVTGIYYVGIKAEAERGLYIPVTENLVENHFKEWQEG